MYHALKAIIPSLLLLGYSNLAARDIRPLRLSQPFASVRPLQTDTFDALGKPFDTDRILLDTPLPLDAWRNSTLKTDNLLEPAASDVIQLAGFEVETPRFAKCEVKVGGTLKADIYIDGERRSQHNLTPGRHAVTLKFLRREGKADTLRVSLESQQDEFLDINPQGKRLYSLEDYLHGRRLGATSLSPSGRFIKYSVTTTQKGGKTERTEYLRDLTTGSTRLVSDFLQWSDSTDEYIRRSSLTDGSVRYERVNPLIGLSTPFFTDPTASSGSFFANERFMLVSKTTEGPKEDKQVFQVLSPDDRIPGWRNRQNIQLLDTRTGLLRPLTIGQHNVLAYPSPKGDSILLLISHEDLTRRPFDFLTAILLNPATMQADTLVASDGFINSAQWMPDGKSLVFSGSPEAFGGIGINDSTGKTPSRIQTELFRYDLTTRQVRSITRDFNPSVKSYQCNPADGQIYALCENRDLQEIFCCNPETGEWKKLPLGESFITSFSLSRQKPMLAYTGQSHSNSDRIRTFDLRKHRETTLLDLDEERMGAIQLGEFHEWNFASQRGDTITGRYYLPPHFDSTRRHPLIVYYYGGCSPVGRYLESYYNFHGWAAMGYVVLVLQPSGATGFGQEFAARHVNAYGDYTADDIIQGTRQFCREHPFVNPEKIGCLGASYGGFMTMYLLTKTDLFAAAMAHAGISNPASYWGYGYWGYSYNATCAADSYPWNNPDLFTRHAPLFNADKVHTPILFLHGAADTNVPIVESTQMFNALKILGRECAFVTVEGQNHHILEYERRIKWVHTFYAWFAKYLQDDPTWWNTLYPEKNL